jgi:hypothetical protein
VLQSHVIRRALPLLLTLALVPATADAAVTHKKAIAGPVEFNGESQFPTYADLGAGIYQATLDRGDVVVQQPENPKDPADPGYEWPPDLDEAISDGAKSHIQVALTITSADAGFATAAAKRFPDVHLWIVPQAKSLSTTKYVTALNGAYAALKARSSKNKVVGQPRVAKLPKGAKLDLFGYTPAADKRLPDLAKLHAAVKKDLFVSGWTLNTAGANGAKLLAAGLKATRKASYVYALGYDGLVDSDVVNSDGRTPKTGLLDNDGTTKRPAYTAFKNG